MIDLTLKFLADEINQYLLQQPNLVIGDLSLVMGNTSRIFDTDTSAVEVSMANRAVISLVNVEEDRLSRQQELVTKNAGLGITYQQPPVFLNLSVLFVMNLKSQEASLRWLSAIIRFFQFQPVFTPLSHPALNSGIEKLTVEMQTLSFEQSNQLWSMLGGKYLPSVLYKVRQISVDENAILGGGGFIRSITINDKGKQPVS
ncbi:MAG: DUF4255 domain-containing protein [Chitinophagaceae bacterium]